MYTYIPNHTHICVSYSGSDAPTLISWGEKFILLEQLGDNYSNEASSNRKSE